MEPPIPKAPAHLAWWSAPALRELPRRLKWVGGAGMQEGVHMVHIVKEIRTCTPANPNEAALEAIMPEAAWEALPRDAVQGLCRPYTPETLRRWLRTTRRQAYPIGAPQAPTPPHHHHTGKGKGKGKGRARGGKGHPGKGVRRGPK